MTDNAHTPDPELEHQYKIEPWTVDPQTTLAGLSAKSAASAAAYGDTADLAYGDDPRQKLDIARPDNAPAPTLIFIHGGYWQGSCKEDRRFPGPVFNALGAAFISVEYRLAPAVTLDEIVDDVRNAVAWIYKNGADYGLDVDRLYVTGNSAGGHLSAAVLADGWQADYGVPEDVLKGGCPVSGIFDLTPLLKTSQRDNLHLTEENVARVSPIHQLPKPGTPLLLSWGGRESDEFKRQSAIYTEACRAHGIEPEIVDCPDDDHFTIMGAFGDPDSALFKAIARMMKLSAS